MKRIGPILGTFLLAVGCSSSDYTVEYVDLSMDKEITHFSDSTFFNSIQCLSAYNGEIYASDQKRCQIFRLDKDLNLLRTIGRSGHGPQELGYIEQFAIWQDCIYIGDAHKWHVSVFDIEGNFSTTVDTEGKIPLNDRFSVLDSHLYYTRPEENFSMIDFSMPDSTLTRFGEFAEFSSLTKTRTLNARRIFALQDRLLAISRGVPQIEVYDRDTKTLLRTFDLMTVPPIREIYHKVTNNPYQKQENTSYSLTADGYLHQDRLYLACSLLNEQKEITQSAILEFDLSGEQIRWTRQLHPGGNFITSFCVTDDYVYGFVPKYSSIRRYPLNR